ncbi:hypothetical protein IMZ11_41405 [Microtetraspora sp. AC03309]|uniref:hypothetical protein n=1 Tax=Microtetraspora sp. AC03309 TaxID=2779376 RepID=UPI001E5FF79A|nr:hypothetical protein [Microtetraspora sp. AC03309]MCC5582074.1 hypothetical protein [Microtetraspora sp. AC03309]
MTAMTDLERELLDIERQALAGEWARIRQAEQLLADVDAGLDRMRQILREM